MILSDGRTTAAEARATYEERRRAQVKAYFAASPTLDQKPLSGATARHGGAFSGEEAESSAD